MPPVPQSTTSVPNMAARTMPTRENLMKTPLGAGPGVKINPHPMIHKNMDTGTESIPHHGRRRDAAPPPQQLQQRQRIAQRAVPHDTSPQADGTLPMIKVRMDGGRAIRQTDPTIRAVATVGAPEQAPEYETAEAFAPPTVVLPLAPDHLRLLRGMLDDEYERIEARRAAGDTHPELVQRAEQVADAARKLDELLAAHEQGAVDPAAIAEVAPTPIQAMVQQVQQQAAPRGAAGVRRAPVPRPQSVAPGGGRLPMITSIMGSSGPMRVNVVKAHKGAHADVGVTKMPPRSPVVQPAGVGAAVARPPAIRTAAPIADGPVPGTEASSIEPAADDQAPTVEPAAIEPVDPTTAPFA